MISPTEEPVDSGGEGLSAGAVAGIIIGVLVVLVIAGAVVYFKFFSSTKSLPTLSMPSISTRSSSSSKPKTTPDAGGFDNPMALGDVRQFATALKE